MRRILNLLGYSLVKDTQGVSTIIGPDFKNTHGLLCTCGIGEYHLIYSINVFKRKFHLSSSKIRMFSSTSTPYPVTRKTSSSHPQPPSSRQEKPCSSRRKTMVAGWYLSVVLSEKVGIWWREEIPFWTKAVWHHLLYPLTETAQLCDGNKIIKFWNPLRWNQNIDLKMLDISFRKGLGQAPRTHPTSRKSSSPCPLLPFSWQKNCFLLHQILKGNNDPLGIPGSWLQAFSERLGQILFFLNEVQHPPN